MTIICFLSFCYKKSPISATNFNAARTTLLIKNKTVIDVKVTHFHIFAIQLQSCFHSWIHVLKSFQSSFKAWSWAPNCSIMGISCMLKMLDHYHSQNIWYLSYAENCRFQFYFLAAFFHKNLLVKLDLKIVSLPSPDYKLKN